MLIGVAPPAGSVAWVYSSGRVSLPQADLLAIMDSLNEWISHARRQRALLGGGAGDQQPRGQ